MPNYKSSAFWVANTQELINNFTFDSTDEDGLFMFVGMGTDQAIYVWRKTGVVKNPQDIPATLGCWKFFSSTQKSDSFELANWTLTKALITNGLSQNRVDLKSYVLVSWDDIVPRLIPVINANEIAEESYNFEVGNSELLTNFSYISSQFFKASLENQKLAPDDENTSLTDFSFINKQYYFQTIENKRGYLDNDVNTLTNYDSIRIGLERAIAENNKIDYISNNSLLTDWGYICLLRL
jgi:hypothetical protein